jgi:hypothetical protein
VWAATTTSFVVHRSYNKVVLKVAWPLLDRTEEPHGARDGVYPRVNSLAQRSVADGMAGLPNAVMSVSKRNARINATRLRAHSRRRVRIAAEQHLSTSHVQSSTVTPRAHRVSTPTAAEASRRLALHGTPRTTSRYPLMRPKKHRDCRRLLESLSLYLSLSVSSSRRSDSSGRLRQPQHDRAFSVACSTTRSLRSLPSSQSPRTTAPSQPAALAWGAVFFRRADAVLRKWIHVWSTLHCRARYLCCVMHHMHFRRPELGL